MKPEEHYEYVPCNLCGGKEYDVIYKPSKKEFNPHEIFSASGGVMGTQQIVRCRHCGLMYVNPRIKPEIVIGAYGDAVDELYVSQEEGRKKTFVKALRLVEKYAPNKGKILDVGAAAGFFLDTAKQSGWETYGVEPSKWMAKWGNDRFHVNIKAGTLKEAGFPDDYFDVVTMWDVLEHTSDPMGELAEANRVLKKGGILIINYPNAGSSLAKLFRSKWWFFLSVHLYYFTPRTVSRMLAKNNFHPLKSGRHFQTLGLEHLIKMVGLYNKPISNLGLKIAKTFRMGNWQIPYYASQANVIARKQ